ncbi:metallophosphoesterase [Poriferisphaera sp. WC338]|uniref:metallophosphoesterase n=1 Tax=Poriferisphaera sp. WC338 TaxID=3425129 RepID=UPI003D815DCF
MKIGVISDTHDRLPTFTRAIELFKRLPVDAIFHAGDYVAPFAAKLIAPDVLNIPLYCVYGNNDGERPGLKTILPNLEDHLTITLDNRTIVMSHFIDWIKPDQLRPNGKPADIVITGHTHEIVNETRLLQSPADTFDTAQIVPTGTPNATLFLNPGECCGWLTNRCSVALLDTNTCSAEIIDVHP